MLALCRTRHREIGAVVVYVVSRFSRDTGDYQDVRRELHGLGNQILPVSVTEAEIASLVEFAEWMMLRIAGIWNSATITNKLRLQHTLFPKGLEVSSEGFGTASEPLFFAGWAPGVDAKMCGSTDR
jgi:hypothetical protein